MVRDYHTFFSTYFCKLAVAIVFSILLIGFGSANATPPDYRSFGRDQSTAYTPDRDEIMRIWIAYVGQGDGILIQLPERLSYEAEIFEEEPPIHELIDILIDGGASNATDANRMNDFLSNIYDVDEQIIEHAIISHHDQDHIFGLEKILEGESFLVDYVYHNGLASYLPGVKGGPSATSSGSGVIHTKRNRRISRWMARFDQSTNVLNEADFVDSLDDARQFHESRFFQGPYKRLINQVVRNDRNFEVLGFDRVHTETPFINDREIDIERSPLDDINFEIIWPEPEMRRYSQWSETINGNSVTFKLTYGNFSMLFTGDHNEKSEEALLDAGVDISDCDVMKVPHHGSDHAYGPFFSADEGCKPVVAVASMGPKGAKSKRVSRGAWQHPSTQVIQWLGGAHRVYHTFLHERRFDWNDITSKALQENMQEESHILIETDGRRFRIVEIPVGEEAMPIPPVSDVQRGNGTRWIDAD